MIKYQDFRKPIVILTALLFHVLLIFHLLFSPVIIVVASQKGIINASRDHFHLRGLRLKAEKENCTSCGSCNVSCPMEIDVMDKVKSDKMSDHECILCGNCIDGCKQKVIRFSTGKN